MIDKKILEHFKKVDHLLYEAALQIKRPVELKSSSDLFCQLCDSIIGQQLSTKVGDVLCQRFHDLFTDGVTPENVVTLTPEDLRAIGTSNSKAHYIIDLATQIVAGTIHLDTLKDMSNEDVITELVKMKGIGPWTAEMFLMFTLGRPDIFSYGDLGLRRGIQKIYNLKKEPTQKYMEKLSKKWSPYRTYAAIILWRSLE